MATVRVARWYIFKPKSQFGLILEELAMEDVGKLLAICYISRPFGIFYGHSV
jgi:hypothetical protein